MEDIREKKKKLLESITREEIYKAVEEIIAEDGIEGLTMNRVAELAGIAKGTIYLYFKDKQDLIHSIVDYTLSPLNEGSIEILESEKNPEVILKEFTRFVVDFFKKNLPHFRILQYRLNHRDKVKPHWEKTQKEYYELTVQKVAKVVDLGIAQNQFRKINSLTFAHIFVHSNVTIVMRYLCMEGESADIDSDAVLLTDIFLNGIKNHN